MKKITVLFILVIILSTYSLSFADDLDIYGEGAVLIDYDTLEVLYEKNSNEKLYPASTTKIMTGILAIENGNLSDLITIDDEVVNLTSGSHIALEPGEVLTLEQLLDALLIESANDAAIAIAKYISGSVEDFAILMNEKAIDLGAINTNFLNPNGLPDENHVSTAYDLALIAKYAMDNPSFRNIVKNYTATIPITNKKNEERYLKSANKLLYSNNKILLNEEHIPIKFEGVNGVKTGYTNAAGHCLVTSLDRNGHKFIAVVLKSDSQNIHSDTHKLLNYGLDNFEKIKISFANKFIDNFNVENGVLPFVSGVTKSDSFYIVNYKDKNKIKEVVSFDNPLEAPIGKGETIGSVKYELGGRVIGETDIVATADISLIPKPSLLSKIASKWYLFVIGILILFRIIALHSKIKRKKLRRKRATLYKI